jgi:hypothetical protein
MTCNRLSLLTLVMLTTAISSFTRAMDDREKRLDINESIFSSQTKSDESDPQMDVPPSKHESHHAPCFSWVYEFGKVNLITRCLAMENTETTKTDPNGLDPINQ